MSIKQLLVAWSIFWSLTLVAIALSKANEIPQLVANLKEIQGVVISERPFRYSQNFSSPMGNPNEKWNYEVSIMHSGNKVWRYIGKSGAPVKVCEPVQLLISRTNPNEIYFKDRLLEKGNPIVYLLGWVFLVVLPWVLVFFAGFLSPHNTTTPLKKHLLTV